MSKEYTSEKLLVERKEMEDCANHIMRYSRLERADRAGNLNGIEQEMLQLCLELTEEEGIGFTSYDELQKKFGRCRDTIKRVLKAISKHISWKFERSIRINGYRELNVIIIERIAK